jgi:hypothetical protein
LAKLVAVFKIISGLLIDGFNSFKGDAVVIVRGGFAGWANALALNQYNFRSQTIQLPPKY